MRFIQRWQDSRTRSDKKRRGKLRARWNRGLEPLERRELLAADMGTPWHNAINPLDVNQDNRITPRDALIVINHLLTEGVTQVPQNNATPLAAQSSDSNGGSTPSLFLDVNGDNYVSPIDALNVVNLLLTAKDVRITTVATDLFGTPITEIPAGSDFQLRAIVEDIREPPAQFGGVFSAYLNVTYDSALASIPQPPTFNFDPFFPLVQTFDATTPGQITGAGASSATATAPGNDPQELWTVLFNAAAPGQVTFTPSFDTIATHEVLLFLANDPLTADQIDFVGSTLTITGNPTVEVASVSQAEGDAGTTPFVFTASLSSSFNQPVTVGYATGSPGGANVATPGVDYQSTSGTLTFSPGTTQQVVTVLVNGDLTIESDEFFNLALSNPTNATLGTNSVALGTIQNDDLLSSLAIGDVTVNNVTAGSTDAVFTVSLSPAVGGETTVEFSTANGTAVAGTDYTATSGTLTFSPGSTTRFITVPVLGDPLPDETETFVVNLSNPSGNAQLQDGQATGTILPAVPIPNLSIADASVEEGDVGTTDLVFTMSLSSPATEQIAVSFATGTPGGGDIATPGVDYTAVSGTVTFAPGTSTAMVTVAVTGDTLIELNEQFLLNLSPVSGTVNTVDSSATGTIINDDGPTTLSIADTTAIGGATTTTNAVFTVSLSRVFGQTVMVSYATQDNTAVANEDYLAQSGILTFASGVVQQLITVPILGSAVPSEDETFVVNLSNLTPGPPDLTISDGQALGTIVRRGLTIGNTSVLEGDTGPTDAVFTVNLSQSQQQQVTVQFATADDTATIANGDYAAASGTLTFAAGETQKLITVAVSGDTTVESNETFFVNLSNATGGIIFSSQAVGTILNDDGQKALIQLQLADDGGAPLPPGATLDIGQEFQLQAFVQDAQADPNGIAAAYLDVFYDLNLVEVSGPIMFGPFYSNIQSGNTSTPGLIDEVGAFGQALPPANPGDPQLLFSIALTALDVGFVEFVADPADAPDHQVLEYTSDTPIPPASVNYVGTSINIGTNVFTVDSVSMVEGDNGTTDFVFTITRFLPSSSTASVVYSTSDGTATATQDYQPQSGTLTFVPGDTTKTVTVPVIGDLTDEIDETFFLGLSNPVGAVASESPGVGTIVDDDGPPTLSVADNDGDEGEDIVFTVSLSQSSGKTVTVAYATAPSINGSPATAGTDYQPVSGTLTFDPGVTQQTVSVPALTDLVKDDDETFRLLLSDPSNATIADGEAVGTINDVPPAEISGYVYADSNNNGLKEGSEVGIANVIVQVLRDGVVVKSTLTGADGSYSLVGLPPDTYSVREIQPGFFLDGRDTRFGIDSPTNDRFDGIELQPSGDEGGFNFGERSLRAEFVPIFLNRRAFFASAIVSGHFGPATTTSGLNLQSGDAWIAFDGGWEGPRTVKALFDHAAGSATMTLYNNDLVAVAISSVTGDGAQFVHSGNAGNNYFLRVSGTNPNVSLTAIDTVSISNVSQLEGNDGTTNFVFTATLSALQLNPVTVAYATSNGTATSDSGDFVAQSGTISFAPGEISKQITIAVNGDTESEDNETFSVVLSSPTNIALSVSTGIGTIQNDDITTFDSSLLIASNSTSGGGATPAAAPANATPATSDAAAAADVEPELLLEAEPALADADDPASATDAVLEEDEDWLSALAVA